MYIIVGMSEYIHKSYNVTVLMYNIVLPAKYRGVIFDDEVDEVVKDVCLDIENRYQIKFPEIETDKDHCIFWCNQYQHIVSRKP